LLIDKMVMKNCRRRHTNLNMAWIDYKKAYDMLLPSWILESLMLVGFGDSIKRLLRYSMDIGQLEVRPDSTNEVGYRLGDRHRRTKHLLFMDDLNLYEKNDCEIESVVGM